MKDICIKLKSSHPTWSDLYDVEIDMYKNWIKKNFSEGTYYIPKRKEPIIFFLSEEDLVIFTLVHGRNCYEIIGNAIEMSRIEKMILREIALERQHEKK